MPPATDRRPNAPFGQVSRWDDDRLRRIRLCVLAQSDLFQLRNEYVREQKHVAERARDLTGSAFTVATERLVCPEAFAQDLRVDSRDRPAWRMYGVEAARKAESSPRRLPGS